MAAERTDTRKLQVPTCCCSCGFFRRRRELESVAGIRAAARYARVFAAPLDTAMVLMDEDGHIWAANRAACRMLGWLRGEVWRAPVCKDRLQAHMDIGFALKQAPCTLHLSGRDGHTIWFDCAPLESPFLLCTLHEDLWMTLIREGVEACAHDIKTELTCAMGTAQILEMNEHLEPNCTLKLTRLKRFCQSAAMMADQLCRDIRLLEPLRDDCAITTDFRKTLREIYEDCRVLAQDKGISMSFSCSQDMVNIGVEEQKLRRILMNFVSNALKFTPPGGSIDLSLERRQVRNSVFAEVEVRDNGLGFSADRLPIQGRRYAPRSGIPGEGTGLGLSIVQTLVRNLRGQLRIESEPGKGTTIRMRFPEQTMRGGS